MTAFLFLLAILQGLADAAHWVQRHQLLTAGILAAAIVTLPILYGIGRALAAAVLTLALIACAVAGQLVDSAARHWRHRREHRQRIRAWQDAERSRTP